MAEIRYMIIGFPYRVAFTRRGIAEALAAPGQMIVPIEVPSDPIEDQVTETEFDPNTP